MATGSMWAPHAPRRPVPADIQLIHFLTTGALSNEDGSPATRFRQKSFFIGSDVRQAAACGIAEYVPVSITQVPKLVANGRFAPDVAFIQMSPPDANGYCSLGVSVDVTAAMVRRARSVIAEINPQMPRTMGDSFVHLDRLDLAVWVDSPILEYLHQPADAIAEQIARYIASIIDDGATLQIGLGRIPNEALKYLADRRDLGIHSDVITEPLIDLIERGIVTGRHKTLHPGRVVASYCLGSRRLYDLIDNNPLFAFHPIEYVADPHVVFRNEKMASVTQAFAVDLTGQVCSDQFMGEFYSGVSTQPDFIRGAAAALGGKPIICLPSTTDDGAMSRIRPLLLAGEGVTVARSDVHYVITEFGIAYLFGKSIRERALALIEIAHPAFRAGLLEEAKRLGYLPAEQSLSHMRAYAVEDERSATLRNGARVLLRPARASDVGGVQDVFYRTSPDDVYTRFFRRLSALSSSEAQRLCNVDHDLEVAFVATVGPRDNERVVGSSCYFVNPATNMAEVAYMILPDYQSTGLGAALQRHMMDHARRRGLRGFVAEILVANFKMVALARKACDNVSLHLDGSTMEVAMIFE